MSPEQVRGENLDARTDLFSFGLVLYEMATGRRAFEGETRATLHEAILKQEPIPARAVNSGLPLKLEKIISKALQKDRAARYQTAAGMRADLEVFTNELKDHHPRRWWTVASGVGVVVVVVMLWFARQKPHSSSAPPDLKLRQLTGNSAANHVLTGAISPNGKFLAYTDVKGMQIQQIETGATQAVPVPSGLKDNDYIWEILTPAWLPDSSRFIANLHPAIPDPSSQGSSIWMISRQNEPPRKLRDNAMAWSVAPDGSSVAFGTNKGWRGERAIWLMRPDGGEARKLFETDENSTIIGYLWSPHAERGLYIKSDDSGDAVISQDLSGGPPITIFPASETQRIEGGFAWLPDGRLLYSIREPGGVSSSCNFWTMRLDEHIGKPVEKPIRLTNWSGYCMEDLSVTADGKRVAFVGSTVRHSVYLADLAAGGTTILKSRELTPDISGGNPMDWTTDSKTIIFFSGATSHNGHDAIYRQRLDEDLPKLIVSASGGLNDARLSPDGKWVLWLNEPEPGGPSVPLQLMRVPFTGGPPEPVFTTPHQATISCTRAPSNLCAVAERTEDSEQVIVTAFDPVKGRGMELLRYSIDPNDPWTACRLSPEGSRFAAITAPDDPIKVFSLSGKAAQAISVRELHNKQFLNWAAGGRGFFVTNGVKGGSELVHVDQQGNSKVMWTNHGGYYPWGLQSPDGRHLAIQGSTTNGNMWTIENF